MASTPGRPATTEGPGRASQTVPGIQFRPLVLDDADGLCDLLLAARAVDGAHEPVTREELRHHWFDHPGVRHETDTIAAIDRDGWVVGAVAVVARDAPGSVARVFVPGAVRPDHRRRGIGTYLIRRAEARARELLAAVPGDVERQMDCESPATARDRVALFEAEGFLRARSFLIMRRDLAEPIPTPSLAPALSLVVWRADLDEATRLAHNDAFRDHWGSDPVSPERWRHFVADVPGFRPDCSWLAFESDGLGGGSVAGYALATVNDDPSGGRVGWLGTIGVRRAWRRQGVASALIARSLASFAAAGASRAGLDVDAQNPTGAVRVYEALGFRPSEESIIYSKQIVV
jgi:mycothiol synthase